MTSLIQAQNFHKLCLINPDILLIRVHKNGSLGAYFKSHNGYSFISNRKAKTKFTPDDVWINLDNIKENYTLIQKRFHPDVIKKRAARSFNKAKQLSNEISQRANKIKSLFQNFLIRAFVQRLAIGSISEKSGRQSVWEYLKRVYYPEQYELPSERLFRLPDRERKEMDNSTPEVRFAEAEELLCQRQERFYRCRTTSIFELT